MCSRLVGVAEDGLGATESLQRLGVVARRLQLVALLEQLAGGLSIRFGDLLLLSGSDAVPRERQSEQDQGP